MSRPPIWPCHPLREHLRLDPAQVPDAFLMSQIRDLLSRTGIGGPMRRLDNRQVWQLFLHNRQAIAMRGYDADPHSIGFGMLEVMPGLVPGPPAEAPEADEDEAIAADAAVAPSPATAAAGPPPWPSGEPASLAACVARLHAAKARIDTWGFQPKYSDAQLQAMPAGTVEDRFLVNVCKGTVGDSETAVVGYRRDSGRTTAWTASFDQVEDGDLDARLQAQKLGFATYDPDSVYTMHIIDTQVAVPGAAPGQTIVPTYEQVGELGVQEFGADIDETILREVMTPEYSAVYAADMRAFEQWRGEQGIGDWKARFDEKTVESFAKDQYGNDQEGKIRFLTRHEYATEIGTNEEFLGTGLTKQVGDDVPGKKFGAQEMLTLEHNPPTIAQRTQAGGLKSVEMKKGRS